MNTRKAAFTISSKALCLVLSVLLVAAFAPIAPAAYADETGGAAALSARQSTGAATADNPQVLTLQGQAEGAGADAMQTPPLPEAAALAADENAPAGYERTDEPKPGISLPQLLSPQADSEFTVQTSGSGVIITGYNGTAAKLSIPSKIGGKKVVAIGEAAFADNTELESVSIPYCVQDIGVAAFYGCSNLSKVLLSQGLLSIDSYAFEGTALTSITLPASVKRLGARDGIPALAFFGCPRLETVYVNAQNKTFKSLSGIVYSKSGSEIIFCPPKTANASLQLPSTVRAIGKSAFQDNANVRRVIMPEGVTKLDDWCFANSVLTAATVPASVTAFGNGPFDGCTQLAALTVKSAAEQPYRFCEGCTKLATVNFSGAIPNIGFRAFKDCTALKSVFIRQSVREIDMSAFFNCTSLSAVRGCAGVERIDEYAFYNTAIASFPWGKKLKYVDADAFSRCASFPNPNYPTYLTKDSEGNYRVYDDRLTIAGTANYDLAKQVLTLVNKERANAGLAALRMDASLQKAAMQRAAEIALYLSHTRPNGSTCFSADAAMTGENIAAGLSTAEGVIDQWMNSAGHKANILGENFRSIGIGCIVVGSTTFWVQAFGNGKGSNTAAGTGKKTIWCPTDVVYDLVDPSGTGLQVYLVSSDPVALSAGGLSLKPRITNAEWTWFSCPISPSSFTWKVANSAIATVEATGKVKRSSQHGCTMVSATSRGGKLWKQRVKW